MSSKVDEIKEQLEKKKREREEKARESFFSSPDNKQEESDPNENVHDDINTDVNVNVNAKSEYEDWKGSNSDKELIGLYLEPEVIKVLKKLNKSKKRGFQSHFANNEIKKALIREGWLK